MNKKISVVVPLLNEEGNVSELHKRIVESCKKFNLDFEIVFVDDGSTDKTYEECKSLSPLKIVRLRKNFGQTAAFDAGIKNSSGDVIVTMDGDLQNDPNDIALLLEKIDEGYDVVSGWRWNRKDSFGKRFFSRGADLLRKVFVEDKIHDSGCSLKAYKKECFDDLDLYGEMHRFIPALLEMQGYKVTEVKVNHFPRTRGVSKYNWKRTIKGLVDMMSIWFWRKFANRPLHLFGAGGVFLFSLGSLLILWMFVERAFFQIPIQGRIWPLIGILFILVGIQLFVSGLLADIMIKSYYGTRKTLNYSIKDISNN